MKKNSDNISEKHFLEIKKQSLILAKEYMNYDGLNDLEKYISELDIYKKNPTDYNLLISMTLFPDTDVFYSEFLKFKKKYKNMAKHFKVSPEIIKYRLHIKNNFENYIQICSSDLGLCVAEKNLDTIKCQEDIDSVIKMANNPYNQRHKNFKKIMKIR